jgi:cytochrome c553
MISRSTMSFRFVKAVRVAVLAMGLGFVVPSSVALAQSAQDRFSTCLACHGEGGKSNLPLTPSLAGQPSFYAITQLFLFREGRRSNEVMSAIAKGMPDKDLQAFSDLIGKLPSSALAPAVVAPELDKERILKGAQIASEHRCGSCHGVKYEGDKQVARLAYQREDYLLQTLKEFKAGKRIGYTSAMNETLAGVSVDVLPDLAYFLANLPK